MTDRELLEMAAKAAGLTKYSEWADEIKDHDSPHYMWCALHSAGPYGQVDSWNPLIDDGDAFRLSVKLGIKVEPKDGFVFVYSDNPDATQIDTIVDNAYATTRHAIVRAAAEIGRGME